MIKRFVVLRRREGMSAAKFHRHSIHPVMELDTVLLIQGEG